MKIRIYIIILLCAGMIARSSAQDLHFTQFYATPLTMNPANTGNFFGLYRIGANYRDQWRSVTIPYQTFSGFADFSIGLNKHFSGDRLGVGLIAFNDKAGDGELSTTKIYLTTAVHKSFNPKNTFIASVGFSAGYIGKSLDFSKLTFDSQWNDFSFDPSQPNNENFANDQINYLDFNAGILLQLMPDRYKSFFLSAALMHLNTATESFLDETNEIGMRPIIIAGGSFRLSKNSILHPQIFYSSQKKAMEIMVGTNYSFLLNPQTANNSSLIFGGWFRYADALMAVAGIEWSGIRLLGSYDFNISKLVPGSQGRGGFELSLVYTGSGQKGRKNNTDCPSFK